MSLSRNFLGLVPGLGTFCPLSAAGDVALGPYGKISYSWWKARQEFVFGTLTTPTLHLALTVDVTNNQSTDEDRAALSCSLILPLWSTWLFDVDL